ncbi:MAG: hypothetical protein EBS91_05795 [Betaproteobacteria bacterium]|nr:hypothetical protein [Betaproteobacteria bacterium]NCA24112.1 hypothetical protein [Betaproteobacteria bacterium]
MNDHALPRLMTLAKAAAALGLPGKSALATEVRRGRLTPIVIAGKRYVTEDALREFVARCHHEQRDLASTCDADGGDRSHGSSSIQETRSAQAAARQTVEELKQRSRDTLPASTRRRRHPVGQATS